MSYLLSVITIIKGIFDLIRMFMDMAEKSKVREAERKKLEREKAISDLANAKTQEEIWDAQERITKNKP